MQADKILDIATRVSTPIALAGLILGILLIIFYAILKLNIFPKLNRALGAEILSTILKYLYNLAMVGLILGFIAYLTPTVIAVFVPTDGGKADVANLPINFEATLKEAIEYAAKQDDHPTVIFKECDDAVLSKKVNKQTYTGKTYTDVIHTLQFHFAGANPDGIYKVRFDQAGQYFEVKCYE